MEGGRFAAGLDLLAVDVESTASDTPVGLDLGEREVERGLIAAGDDRGWRRSLRAVEKSRNAGLILTVEPGAGTY
jgi:hypothetical protein